ncbi:MAG: C-GCAxxG-C-C family protein [Clostridia bacterium]|nr:C-GCAxxG-C-C family protein [Clostridia bacterium]
MCDNLECKDIISDDYSYKRKAVNYFNEGYLCSQAVFMAYAKDLGLTKEQAAKIAGPFGSGMRIAETCGAVTGALMVIGMIYGISDPKDLKAKQHQNHATEEFIRKFERIETSVKCKDLLRCDIRTPEGRQFAIENNLFKCFCPKMVGRACDMLKEVIEEENAIIESEKTHE